MNKSGRLVTDQSWANLEMNFHFFSSSLIYTPQLMHWNYAEIPPTQRKYYSTSTWNILFKIWILRQSLSLYWRSWWQDGQFSAEPWLSRRRMRGELVRQLRKCNCWPPCHWMSGHHYLSGRSGGKVTPGNRIELDHIKTFQTSALQYLVDFKFSPDRFSKMLMTEGFKK